MQPEDDDLAFLWDIVDSGHRIKEFIGDLNEDGFLRDSKTQSAVIRQQEIIGEAVKQLSMKFRDAHTAIPWREIAGMRDVLIHAYNQVRLDRVWRTATESIPELIVYLEPLLRTPDEDLP